MKRIIIILAVAVTLIGSQLACVNENPIGDMMGIAKSVNNAAFGTPTPTR